MGAHDPIDEISTFAVRSAYQEAFNEAVSLLTKFKMEKKEEWLDFSHRVYRYLTGASEGLATSEYLALKLLDT
jgi:hypothetical protein